MVVGMKLWLALLPMCALGHGQLTVPLVRGDSQGRKESYEQRAPVYVLAGNRGGYSATSMRCHDFQPSNAGPETSLQAGESFDATWTMEAGHPGDCYFYLSYDEDPSSATNFFKIAAIPGCGAPDGLNIPSSVTMAVQLPAELPPCEHCVLRWEWTGHQQVVDIEFYVQCADVQITSSATPVIPRPMTAISGIEHLPQDASGYRQVYSGQGPSEQYLVGPAIASYTPCSAGTPGCLGASGVTGSATTAAATAASSSAAPAADTTEAVQTTVASTSLRSSTTGSAMESPINVDGSIGTCPLPGNGLPSFVSQCYCGFITGPNADGCGPDDGSACWCRCCCHYRSGTCRYQMLEQSFSSSLALAPQLSILALSVALPFF